MILVNSFAVKKTMKERTVAPVQNRLQSVADLDSHARHSDSDSDSDSRGKFRFQNSNADFQCQII